MRETFQLQAIYTCPKYINYFVYYHLKFPAQKLSNFGKMWSTPAIARFLENICK